MPLDAVRRLGPDVDLVQPRDGILFHTREGMSQQLRTVGEGVLDWDAALAALGEDPSESPPLSGTIPTDPDPSWPTASTVRTIQSSRNGM